MTAARDQERKPERRDQVARLQQEGRPAGHPRLGTKHVGRRGNRRAVLDPVYHELAGLICKLRDEQGLSFNRISDLIEQRAAEIEGRKPRPRWDRTSGWSKQQCVLVYHRHLAKTDLPREATHRRCKTCNESLPLKHFEGTGQTCRDCQVTGPVRRMESRRRRSVETALVALGRGIDQGLSPDTLKPLIEGLLQLTNGVRLGAMDIAQAITKAARDEPGSKKVFNLLKAAAHLGNLKHAANSGEPSSAAMSDAELQRELRRTIRREYRPLIDAVEELANAIKREPKNDLQ